MSPSYSQTSVQRGWREQITGYNELDITAIKTVLHAFVMMKFACIGCLCHLPRCCLNAVNNNEVRKCNV